MLMLSLFPLKGSTAVTHVFASIFALLFQHFRFANTMPDAAVIASTDAALTGKGE